MLELVVTDEGFKAVQPTDGSACRHPVLDYGHPGVAIGVELRRHEHLRDVAVDLEEAAFRVYAAITVRVVWVHEIPSGPCAMTDN